MSDNDKNKNGIDDDFELEERKWFIRKQIALRAFYSCLIIIFGAMIIAFGFPEAAARLESVMDIVLWGMAGLFSLVGTFLGVTTWYDVSKRR